MVINNCKYGGNCLDNAGKAVWYEMVNGTLSVFTVVNIFEKGWDLKMC